MNILSRQLICLSCFVFTLPTIATAQSNLVFDLTYQVNRVYPYTFITKEKLAAAQTLLDLNSRYKADWIKEYISVEIVANQQGKSTSVTSKNDILSSAQKELMLLADAGTDVSIRVEYLPDNNLANNEIKELSFNLSIEPEKVASYPGSPQQLKQYLRESAMDKIPSDSFQQYQLTAVKFTIDETGRIVDPHIFESSKDKVIDAILLETICNMPTWTPATYANGTHVAQDFVFTVGDMESCVVNLLSIREKPLKE